MWVFIGFLAGVFFGIVLMACVTMASWDDDINGRG
jgi:hypothetical protein